MNRAAYLLGLSLPAYLTAYLICPDYGAGMPQALRLLLLVCCLAFLAGIAGAAGMFERGQK
ncbi:hypothetical protein DEIPH_ctg052orf0045 [Deinococcus phoenicis]|uniref:Uncharacterized protein n=1 Tax=Deinococcus phoenicis TaxID=1476583 RepID=A0A016QMH8_9DEIO|nr:hypothetical protein [Deinococcus phoenicis]EYB67047.1 hypothetical protein DEIPH_ctg052orf0045 [Deinococcus phoenicis]